MTGGGCKKRVAILQMSFSGRERPAEAQDRVSASGHYAKADIPVSVK